MKFSVGASGAAAATELVVQMGLDCFRPARTRQSDRRREGGGTRIAPSLQAFKGTDEQFIGAVLDGRQGTAMAPYRSVFSPEVARKIREYVRALARTN